MNDAGSSVRSCGILEASRNWFIAPCGEDDVVYSCIRSRLINEEADRLIKEYGGAPFLERRPGMSPAGQVYTPKEMCVDIH